MTDPVDKFLSDAITAARDHADDNVDDGAHTRLRLRESLANHGATRRKRFTLIAAVIASLFGSTAFAYWAGWRPPWSQPAVTESHDEESLDQVSMRLPETRGGSAKSARPETVETIVTMEKAQAVPAIPDAGLVAKIEPPPVPPPAPVETKSVETKPAPVGTKPARRETKPIETKSAPIETKSAPIETKPAHTVTPTRPRIAKPAPIETKPAPIETKPVETKPAPVETKASPVDTKPVETKPTPVEVKPETKPAPVATTPRVTNQTPRVESPKSQPSADIAAYRNAHNLHFRGNDPKAALAAWDAYLAKYPNGSLALEARYDRALVLVKLARWTEARAALAPFANGKVGTYRQKEAAEILAAIRDR